MSLNRQVRPCALADHAVGRIDREAERHQQQRVGAARRPARAASPAPSQPGHHAADHGARRGADGHGDGESSRSTAVSTNAPPTAPISSAPTTWPKTKGTARARLRSASRRAAGSRRPRVSALIGAPRLLQLVALLGDRRAQDRVLQRGQLGEGRRRQGAPHPGRRARPRARHRSGSAPSRRCGRSRPARCRPGPARRSGSRRPAPRTRDSRARPARPPSRVLSTSARSPFSPHTDGRMAIWLNSRQMKTSPMRRVGELLQPARPRPVADIGREQRRRRLRSSRYWQITEESVSTRSPSTSTGMRRNGLSSENRSLPKNGTRWSTS